MQLSKLAIRKLKEIIQSDYNINISVELAEKLGVALVNIYAEVLKPGLKGNNEQ